MAGAIDENGHVCALRLELPANCEVGVVVPDFVLPTSQSRAVLPPAYSREDVVFNLQRAGLLVAALASGRMDALGAALADRLHQPYRAPLVPGFAEVLALRAEGLLGCVLSGAGPSVLVFFEHGGESVCELVKAIFERHLCAVDVLIPGVAGAGYEIS